MTMTMANSYSNPSDRQDNDLVVNVFVPQQRDVDPRPHRPTFPNQVPPQPQSPLSTVRLLGDPGQTYGYNFARITFFILVVILIATTALTMLTWLVFGSDFPVFQVQHLDMPAFNITDSTLMGEWNANISIQNPNHKFEVVFDHIQMTLVYKEFLLDTSAVTKFHLGKNEKTSMYVKFEVTKIGVDVMDMMWIRDMGTKRGKGFLDFDLDISLDIAYKYGVTGWSKKTNLRVICEDLEVKFPENFDFGGGISSNDNMFKDCLLLS